MLQPLIIIFLTLFISIESAPPPATTKNPLLAKTETISLEGLDFLLKHAENLFLHPKLTTTESQHELDLTESLQPPINEPYNFYLPVFLNPEEQKMDVESKNLLKFSPPEKLSGLQTNYYATKPKKIPKKYSSSMKHVNVKPSEVIKMSRQGKSYGNEWEAMLGNVNENSDNEHQPIIFDDSYFGIDANIPIPEFIEQQEAEASQQVKTSQQKLMNSNKDEVIFQPTLRQKEKERIEYQMHGYDGPKSYKFGYDTGNGKDRQYRFEERNRDGDVIGEYGYFDKNGKMKRIKYSSTSETGFKINN